MHILFELCFPLPQSVKATIRDYSRLFATIQDYSRLRTIRTIRYSLFAIRVFQTPEHHPPLILKNIPDSINKRLSEISSDRECFDNAKTVYQEALNKSDYNYILSFNNKMIGPHNINTSPLSEE